jgi:hypothetical protein
MPENNFWPAASNWLLTLGAFVLMLGALGQAVNDMLDYRQFFGSVPEATNIVLSKILPFGNFFIYRTNKITKIALAVVFVPLLLSGGIYVLIYASVYCIFVIPKEVSEILHAKGDDAEKIAKAGRSVRLWFVIFLGSLAVTIGAAIALRNFYNGS